MAKESLGGGLPRHSCVPSHMGAVSSERLGTGWRPPLSYQCSDSSDDNGLPAPNYWHVLCAPLGADTVLSSSSGDPSKSVWAESGVVGGLEPAWASHQ